MTSLALGESPMFISQPTYRSFHSTKTAQLKIQNDIFTSVREDSCSNIVRSLHSFRLYKSLHFTCECLKDCFGVDGAVLVWINSYLTNHKQEIKQGDSFFISLWYLPRVGSCPPPCQPLY